MLNAETPELTVPVNENDHIQGAANAPVTLVEYGDFECSHCGAAHLVVKRIQETMGDRLRFVFRNFPLTQIHSHAQHAAEAAEIAASEDSFWEMHDILYENQKALADPDLIAYAKVVGLDAADFAEDLTNGTYAEKVRADFLGGVESGVNGTPTFFINNRRYNDSASYETLLAALENA